MASLSKDQILQALKDARANFNRQFGATDQSDWIYDDLADYLASLCCDVCGGSGLVGGPSGQTAENFNYDTIKCPVCGED